MIVLKRSRGHRLIGHHNNQGASNDRPRLQHELDPLEFHLISQTGEISNWANPRVLLNRLKTPFIRPKPWDAMHVTLSIHQCDLPPRSMVINNWKSLKLFAQNFWAHLTFRGDYKVNSFGVFEVIREIIRVMVSSWKLKLTVRMTNSSRALDKVLRHRTKANLSSEHQEIRSGPNCF